jgi:hypothetical protein
LGTDIISGVMAAAEPSKLSKARTKLASLADAPIAGEFQSKLVEAAGFIPAKGGAAPDLIMDVMAHADRSRVADAAMKLAGADHGDLKTKDIAREKVLKQFESTLLANSLESIMPEPHDALTGGGPAASIWRGQQIQFVSEAIAERSPLGLVDMFSDSPSKSVQAANGPGRIRPFAFDGGEEGQS